MKMHTALISSLARLVHNNGENIFWNTWTPVFTGFCVFGGVLGALQTHTWLHSEPAETSSVTYIVEEATVDTDVDRPSETAVLIYDTPFGPAAPWWTISPPQVFDLEGYMCTPTLDVEIISKSGFAATSNTQRAPTSIIDLVRAQFSGIAQMDSNGFFVYYGPGEDLENFLSDVINDEINRRVACINETARREPPPHSVAWRLCNPTKELTVWNLSDRAWCHPRNSLTLIHTPTVIDIEYVAKWQPDI